MSLRRRNRLDAFSFQGWNLLHYFVLSPVSFCFSKVDKLFHLAGTPFNISLNIGAAGLELYVCFK